MDLNSRYYTAWEEKKCRAKKSFESESMASGKATFYWIKNRINLKPYRCPVCSKYHLTKQPQKK